MANTIKPKRSYTASNTPTLASGEVGVNAADGKIWIGNAAGSANVLVSSLARSDHTGTLTVTNGGTGLGTLTANNVILGNGTSTPSFVAPSTSGNVLTSNGTTWQSTAPSAASGMPTGAIMPFAAISPPTGYLLCDGSAVSRTTYSALFSTISPSRGTITVTIASPAVVTLSAHGFQTGDIIYLTTTGALPTGLSQNTLYYVINVTSSTFRLATSAANATAGTAINTSGTQSGTHTLVHCPYGLGNGSTTFNVPNLLQRTPMMAGSTGAGLTARVMGTNYGTDSVTLSSANIPTLTTGNQSVNHTHSGTTDGQNASHYHQNYSDGINSGTMGRGAFGFGGGTGGGYQGYLIVGLGANGVSTSYTGYQQGDHGHTFKTGDNSANHSHTYTNASPTSVSNIQPSLVINFIIKT